MTGNTKRKPEIDHRRITHERHVCRVQIRLASEFRTARNLFRHSIGDLIRPFWFALPKNSGDLYVMDVRSSGASKREDRQLDVSTAGCLLSCNAKSNLRTAIRGMLLVVSAASSATALAGYSTTTLSGISVSAGSWGGGFTGGTGIGDPGFGGGGGGGGGAPEPAVNKSVNSSNACGASRAARLSFVSSLFSSAPPVGSTVTVYYAGGGWDKYEYSAPLAQPKYPDWSVIATGCMGGVASRNG